MLHDTTVSYRQSATITETMMILGSGSSRRRLLRAAAGGALGVAAAGLVSRRQEAQAMQSGPAASTPLSDALLQAFEADIEAALGTFGIVGAAVAIVQGNRIIYRRGFGSRHLQSGAPVTEATRFRVASNTKSMTALLVAKFVDDGVLGWDDRVIDVWPGFRTPERGLTQSMRVRDLMGHASGLGETLEFYLADGSYSPTVVLQSIANLPVVSPPGTAYYYNNTLFALAGYLGSLRQGTEPAALDRAYADLMQQRVFDPAGMADAVIADDPRPLGEDYATPYMPYLFGGYSPTPFNAVYGIGPAGSALASVTDMARYLITQLNGGVAPDGTRVVSAANLAVTHRPGIEVLPDVDNGLPSVLLPDTTAMHYCMGWFDQTFKDGRHLLWHAGGVDGFASLMGFFPRDGIGFVILTNVDPSAGSIFNFSVQSSFLGRLFGLNREIPSVLASAPPVIAEQRAALAAQTRPVDPAAVRPFLGLYSTGFLLELIPPTLYLRHDIRTMQVLALEGGGYVVENGPLMGKRIDLSIGVGSAPAMAIDGFPVVTWLTGG
jgi:CubicO group peptidase (beta-lactamase class C family)